MANRATRMTMFLAMGAFTAALSACDKQQDTGATGAGPAEKAGQQLDAAAAKAGEALNQAAEKTGEGLQHLGQKLQQSADNAQKKNDTEHQQ